MLVKLCDFVTYFPRRCTYNYYTFCYGTQLLTLSKLKAKFYAVERKTKTYIRVKEKKKKYNDDDNK